MNQRLEGWKLALAVLVPAAIVAVAIWFALQALSGDDGTSIDSSQQDDALLTPTPTEPPETNELDEPTVIPTPTPLELPPPPPGPTVTTTPAADATPTPTPTRTPTSQTPGPRPTATPTVDPNNVTITCTGATFPVSLDAGDTLPPLAAAVSPPEREAGLRFLWNFGNGRTAEAPNTGAVTYSNDGSYAVTLQATDTASGRVVNVTCGTVNVGGTTGGTITVSCQVRPTATGLPWDQATTNDLMRVTTTWRPTDVMLTLQYEFGINDPIIFSNDASSGDNLTRVFSDLNDTVKIFWRNEDTGASGRISCPAFSNQTGPTPTSYAGAVAP